MVDRIRWPGSDEIDVRERWHDRALADAAERANRLRERCSDMATTGFFPYRFDRRWDPLFLLLGVKRDDGVELTDSGTLRATFGYVSVETPLDNIDHTLVTGPHRWYTAVGLRLSFADDGLTFGTNHQSGLCIAFRKRIPRVIGFRDHSALWVSVADPEGLAAAIGS